jgi:hypothetical protein
MPGGAYLAGGATFSQVALALVGRLTRYTFNLILIAGILVILAIPVSIGLARLTTLHPNAPAVAAAKTPRPVPTPYSGYASYTSKLFSISYPKDWGNTTSAHQISCGCTQQEADFTSADKTTLFTIGTLAAVPSDQGQSTLQAVARGYLGAAAANYTTIAAPAVGKTVDGKAAIEIDFSCDYLVSAQHMVTLHATALLRTQGLTTYLVIYAAPHDQFAAAQSQTFNPMLASLVLDD